MTRQPRAAAGGMWLMLLMACSEPAPPEWTLVLRNVRLVHPGGSVPSNPATVVITGDRITAIHDDDDEDEIRTFVQQLAGVDPSRVLDLGGQFMTPGFIDAHVHFLDSASLYTSPDDYDLRAFVPHEEERERIETEIPQTLQRTLCAGVTTAVGFGGPSWELGARERYRDSVKTARLATSGPFFANFPVGEFTLWTQADPVLIQLRSAEDARRHVQRLVDSGVDLAKIGVASIPSSSGETFQPVLDAFVRESHASGLRVAAHAEELELAKLVLRSGVDILAHTVVDQELDAEFLELAKSAGVVVTSGVSAFDSYNQVLGQEMTLLDVERQCGDPAVIRTWDELEEIPEGERPEVPAGIVWGGSDEGRRILMTNIRLMMDAGIPIAVGTNGGQIGSLHGAAFHRELRWLAQAGMSPVQLVSAATANGAKVLGVTDRGAIEDGMLADFVVLSENPLDSVEHFASIVAVVRGGVYLSKEELSLFEPNGTP